MTKQMNADRQKEIRFTLPFFRTLFAVLVVNIEEIKRTFKDWYHDYLGMGFQTIFFNCMAILRQDGQSASVPINLMPILLKFGNIRNDLT